MFGTRTSDDVFFSAFRAQAEKAMAGAQELRTLFTEIDASHHDLEKAAEGPASSRVVARAEGIKRLEQEADSIAHEAMRRLHNTWITPIDREHIHALFDELTHHQQDGGDADGLGDVELDGDHGVSP